MKGGLDLKAVKAEVDRRMLEMGHSSLKPWKPADAGMHQRVCAHCGLVGIANKSPGEDFPPVFGDAIHSKCQGRSAVSENLTEIDRAILFWIQDCTKLECDGPAHRALVRTVERLVRKSREELFEELVKTQMDLQLAYNRLRVINGAVTDQTICYEAHGKPTTYAKYRKAFRKAKGLPPSILDD